MSTVVGERGKKSCRQKLNGMRADDVIKALETKFLRMNDLCQKKFSIFSYSTWHQLANDVISNS
jgi:hypothetical protein